MKTYKYDTISRLYLEPTQSKVNIYGVITELHESRNTTSTNNLILIISIIDTSCTSNEKLKCTIFSVNKEHHDGLLSCKIGNIIRFHRLKTEAYCGSPQGKSGPGFSWICFDRDSDTYDFKKITRTATFTEQEKENVKHLRDWLRTNHHLKAESSTQHLPAIQFLNLKEVKPIEFSKAVSCSFNDVICQVCAVCSQTDLNNNTVKLLYVWDGTSANFPIGQEQLDFRFDKRTAYFANDITELIYTVFVYEEHIKKCARIEPGDFILLRNIHFPGKDQKLKMPTGGFKYFRDIIRLTMHDLNYIVSFENDQIKSAIKSIHKKSQEYNVCEMSEENFRSGFVLNETLYFTANSQQINDLNESNLEPLPTANTSPIKRTISFSHSQDLNGMNNTTSTPYKKPRNSSSINSTPMNSTQTLSESESLIRCLDLAPCLVPKESRSFVDNHYFYSFFNLIEHADQENYTRCSITARVESLSFDPYPRQYSVFVNCKTCGYFNFVPFDLSLVYYKGIDKELENILKQDNTDDSTDDDDDESEVEIEVENFGFKWLKSAKPSELKKLKIINKESNEIHNVMYYRCPRCYRQNKENHGTKTPLLEYVYRFWFDLLDREDCKQNGNKKNGIILNRCLMDTDLAEKFVNVNAIEFFIDAYKAEQVSTQLQRNLKLDYLFIIDTFKMNSSLDKQHKNSKILYKIVDFDAIN